METYEVTDLTLFDQSAVFDIIVTRSFSDIPNTFYADATILLHSLLIPENPKHARILFVPRLKIKYFQI